MEAQNSEKKEDQDKKPQAELPQFVEDFLLDPERSKINLSIIRKFDLNLDQEDLYFDITDRVISKELKLDDFPAVIEKEFGLDKEKSKKIALEILGNVFLPMDNYLGDVSSIIKRLGGDPNNFTVPHIILKKISPNELIKEIFIDTGLTLEDGVLEKRLKNIVINRFNGIRDDEETVATLMRKRKLGGLEVDEPIAKKIVQIIKAKMGAFQLFEEEVSLKERTVAIEESDQIQEDKEERKPAPPEPKKSNLIYGSEEDREIEYHKKELKKKKIVYEAINFDEEVKKSIENILQKGKLLFEDEDSKQKFLNLVSARLRDVRDKNETLEFILREKSMGGFGLEEKIAQRISNLIETEFEFLSNLGKKVEFSKLEEWKIRKEAERKEKEGEEKKKEEKVLERRWSKLIGDAHGVKKISSSQKLQKGEAVKQGAQTKVDLSPKFFKKIPKIIEPITPLALSAPAQSVTASLPSALAPQRPKVENIKFTPRLVGPVEELRKMTINDFRRLSKNPEEAREKIIDKIELLEDESYTKKVEGIRAWQESEPPRVYFEILNQSMKEMKSVIDVIEEREEKKLPNITKKEFDVLMKLNQALRV